MIIRAPSEGDGLRPLKKSWKVELRFFKPWLNPFATQEVTILPEAPGGVYFPGIFGWVIRPGLGGPARKIETEESVLRVRTLLSRITLAYI